jgi:hypothetical protein
LRRPKSVAALLSPARILTAEATMHSMPMFGFFDVILAGIIGLIVLIAVVMTLPDLIRTMKIHAM